MDVLMIMQAAAYAAKIAQAISDSIANKATDEQLNTLREASQAQHDELNAAIEAAKEVT